VILHYLRLSFWPDGLVLDYGWPLATTFGQIVPQAVAVGGLAAATIAASVKRKPIGFLGAWFFLILSVTSTVLPIADLAYEHRMYLPLAAVVCLIVVGGYALAERTIPRFLSAARWTSVRTRAGLVLLTVVVAMLTVVTIRRNLDYRSDLVVWMDVVNKRPENGRGHANLGLALAARDRVEEALPHFLLGCKYSPRAAKNQHNTGLALFVLGRIDEAKPYILEALRLKPNFATAHYNLGRVLAAQGEFDQAVTEYAAALEIEPDHPESYLEIGRACEKQGRVREAIEAYNSALRLPQNWPEAMSRLAIVLAAQSPMRDLSEARRLSESAVSLSNAESADAFDALAEVAAAAGRFSEAVQAAEKAIALASEAGDTKLSNEIDTRLRAYRKAAGSKR
jgi:tetratricopeptide (TPR) repeat protein